MDIQMKKELNEVKFTIQHNNSERTSLLSECNKQSIACKKVCKKKEKSLSVKDKLKSLKI